MFKNADRQLKIELTGDIWAMMPAPISLPILEKLPKKLTGEIVEEWHRASNERQGIFEIEREDAGDRMTADDWEAEFSCIGRLPRKPDPVDSLSEDQVQKLWFDVVNELYQNAKRINYAPQSGNYSNN